MAFDQPDKHPLRSLGIFVVSGASVFSFFLFALIYAMSLDPRIRQDPSVSGFYPIVAGAGALFGFVMWWFYESGGSNPFHD